MEVCLKILASTYWTDSNIGSGVVFAAVSLSRDDGWKSGDTQIQVALAQVGNSAAHGSRFGDSLPGTQIGPKKTCKNYQAGPIHNFTNAVCKKAPRY
jgi:hypothetical protein